MNSVLMKLRDLENCIDLNPDQESLPLNIYLNSDLSDASNALFLLNIETNDPTKIYNIVVPKDCHTTLIEIHSSNDINETRMTITLESGSQLQHFVLKSGKNKHFQRHLEVFQAEQSMYTAFDLCIHSEFNESNAIIHLQGAKSNCEYYYLTALQKKEQAVSHLLFHHYQKECQSKCIARNILDEFSLCKLIGKIIVHQGARKSNAELESKNILLAKTAQVINDPQFEIYHDDVSCKHGATVGQLDKNAIFYLKSRGIPENEAKTLLLNAFMEPILARISLPELQPWLDHFRNFAYA